MNVLPHPQHSPEWHTARSGALTASEAPAVLSASLYTTRAALLRTKHTGVAAEVDAPTQKRFDNGHRVEELARPLAEQIVGEDLYNVTGQIEVFGLARPLLASFDGLTMDESIAFEHKALGPELRKAFAAGAAEDPTLLPLHYRAQMQQQCMVAGCERVLFMASEWDAEGNLVEEHHCWFLADAHLGAKIVEAWIQFERDLAAYTPTPRPEPVVIAPVENLPAVAVRMDGALVVQSNLPAFGLALREFVSRVPVKPSTDTEFAQTEAACKALKRAEEALDAAEANALASLADVNEMRRMVADFRELARSTRLASEKMVERRKLEVKEEAVARARRALDNHIAAMNAEIAPYRLPPIAADFAGCIRGLKSVASMNDKLDGLLATTKIAAEVEARAIRQNVAVFQAEAAGHEFLFADLGQVIHKAADDFKALVQGRIAQHKVAEAERERKLKEAEDARVAAEAQRLAAKQIEDARVAALAEQRRVEAAIQIAQVQACRPEDRAMLATPAGAELVKAATAALLSDKPAADANARAFVDRMEPATLNLGEICARLGFTVNAAFVAERLQVQPAKVDRASKLYTERQFQTICRQLLVHVGKVSERCGAEVPA